MPPSPPPPTHTYPVLPRRRWSAAERKALRRRHVVLWDRTQCRRAAAPPRPPQGGPCALAGRTHTRVDDTQRPNPSPGRSRAGTRWGKNLISRWQSNNKDHRRLGAFSDRYALREGPTTRGPYTHTRVENHKTRTEKSGERKSSGTAGQSQTSFGLPKGAHNTVVAMQANMFTKPNQFPEEVVYFLPIRSSKPQCIALLGATT